MLIYTPIVFFLKGILQKDADAVNILLSLVTLA